MMTLTKSEIDKIIKMDLNDWEFINSKIVRFIPRCDEVSLGKIVKAIWDYAEKVDHHPDVLLTYSGVKITLFTHDESGVTEKDIRFAQWLAKIY
jgi:4a-hydroxytetrahydrobiopterin dehydratase